jgi:uncharacterized SAM-binding protein YcdF (DUF218 family)
MPRAMRLARLGKLNAAAFPTDWRAVPEERPLWLWLMPSVDSMFDSWMALKEHIAMTLDIREGDLK